MTLPTRCLAAVVATLLLHAASALAGPAGGVAVICDREIPPYRALLESLTSACDCVASVIPPQEASREGLEQRLRTSGVRAVLGVGLQAREAVEGIEDLPVALIMVPQVGPWVAARANRSGIELALAPRQHLATLRRVFPQAKRIGVFFDPAQTGWYVREAQAAAGALGFTLVTHEIARPGELSRHLGESRGQVDVIWVLPDPTVLQGENINVLLLASFESRTPLYGFARKYLELGAVAASQLDFAALGRQVADVLRRMTSTPAGAAGPRWEYARGARLLLNQKMARKMGIVLEPDVLESAADVIR